MRGFGDLLAINRSKADHMERSNSAANQRMHDGPEGRQREKYAQALVPSENLIRWIRSRKENRIMSETDGDLLQTYYVGLLLCRTAFVHMND
jgi:hypothetical protein